ncbi:microtubule-associated protein 9 isoform X2 [Alligator mississippiensis]|uniref:Microtubule-associated protein 9 isoform B n=1 Tax=Alligator mississippiensis TaxID=8496 RepID=A0A151PB07_ALLMI|nr:microtubule-associated protein 9 isoform X2 [Alligator mississippiensis]KYO46286.1 microtubule-associated protein 9 isoform B [Alligator mississippiensis]
MSRPAAAQRSAFQDELQEAVFARAGRQQAADYSDDVDTDEDGMLSSTVEELPESISAIENSLKKSVDFEVSFSDEETPQKVNPLKKETADDFFPTTDEEKPQQAIVVESQNLSDYKEDENVYLQSQNVGDDDREVDDKFSVTEEITYDGKEGDHQNELPVAELQTKRESVIEKEEENKPVPKPREHRIKNASFSAENISIHLLEDHCKPLPQPRSVLRRSSPVKDKDITRAEDKTTSTVRLSSFSAPSSLTRLNDLITSERRVLSECPSPEGPWLPSSSPSLRIHFPSTDERTGDSDFLMCGEGSLPKDHVETEDKCSDLILEDNGRKSPSVIELMMTAVYEKTKKSHKSTDDSPEENLQTLEKQMIIDDIKEVSLNDKPECMVAASTSKDSIMKDGEEKQAVPQKVKPSSSGRSLTSTYLKKAGKAVPPSTTTSSQYLGTLKVLDNKHLQKYSAELDKADHLRAAVYQDWLEKKRVFLLELQRIKRNKTEDLKSKIEKKEAAKKEEAIASFEAWKAMKKREAKKVAEKKKLEELKKRRATEQNEEKKEEAQKAFEKWKEKKAEYLREQSRKEKQAEQIRKKKEEEVIAEKKRESMSAVEKWKEKKEEFIKQKNVEKIHEKKNEEIQQAEREEKDKRAIEEYERWLERKERRELIEKKQKKLQVILEDETPPPWSPPGKVASTRSY